MRAIQEKAGASGRRTTFRLISPQAREVSVAGTFNNWDPARDPMKRKGNGPWVLIRHLPRGVHEYRFVVDGFWTSDPMNGSRCPNPFGGENCIIEI